MGRKDQVTQPDSQQDGTVVGQLTATGTGVCHDKDGNLLDSKGKIVALQPDKDGKK